MPRWVQKKKEGGGYEMVEINSERSKPSLSIHGFHEPYQSPIDGSIISDPKSLREHNERHGVVHSAEYTPEYYEKKRQERERPLTTAEKWARKAEINEHWNAVERGYKHHYNEE